MSSSSSEEEVKDKITPPPEIDLKEKFTNEKDPDLKQYMLRLGIDPLYEPPTDPRRVILNSLTFIFEESDPVILFDTEESFNSKKNRITLEEGCNYKLRLSVRIQHNIVFGFKGILSLHYQKNNIRLSTEVYMLGTFAPKNDDLVIDVPGVTVYRSSDWLTAPQGVLMRGEFRVKLKFVDDDGNIHREITYLSKIIKKRVNKVEESNEDKKEQSNEIKIEQNNENNIEQNNEIKIEHINEDKQEKT